MVRIKKNSALVSSPNFTQQEKSCFGPEMQLIQHGGLRPDLIWPAGQGTKVGLTDDWRGIMPIALPDDFPHQMDDTQASTELTDDSPERCIIHGKVSTFP